jgi:hypothetical protein
MVATRNPNIRINSSPLGGRPAEAQEADPQDQQPQRQQGDRQGQETREEFSEQQRIAIDRLRQDPAQGPLVELCVHRVEAQRDRNDRRHQPDRVDERERYRVGRHRQQTEKEKRTLADRFANRRCRKPSQHEGNKKNQRLDHDHPNAAQLVRRLFGEDDPHPGEGRAATPHGAPRRNSGYRPR